MGRFSAGCIQIGRGDWSDSLRGKVMSYEVSAIAIGILGAVMVALTGCVGTVATIREPGAGERVTVIVQKESIGSDPQPLKN